MLHYFKFRQDLLDPQPGKDVYVKRGAGKGWPEECPPIRAANAFGFDLLANFDVTFIQGRGGTWRVEDDVVLDSDFDWAAHDGAQESGEGRPLTQQYAWFWEKGQRLPHVITDNVWKEICNQVKVSSFLFLKSDPNELLLMTDATSDDIRTIINTAAGTADPRGSRWYPCTCRRSGSRARRTSSSARSA